MASFPVIFINVLSITIIAIFIVYAWKQRQNTGAVQVIVALIFMMIWAIGSFVEMISTGFELKLIWRNITQIGAFYAPASCLFFCIVYSNNFQNIRKKLTIIIYCLQTIFVLLIFTDQWHHLARESIQLVENNIYQTIIVHPTPLGYIFISFNFIYMAVALLLLIVFALRTNNMMRKQVLVTTAGLGVAVIYALIKVSSNESFARIAPISSVFALVSFTFLIGILRYDFLMVLPFARKDVFNIINEGIIISSLHGEVIDANKAAMRMLSEQNDLEVNHKSLKMITHIIEIQYPEWHKLMLLCQSRKMNLTYLYGNDSFYYDCKTYIVKNKNDHIIGTLSVIHDVTEQRISNDLLIQRAQMDGLTGIYNRITFIEITEKELEHTENDVCLIFLDIDNFKYINDQYGHIAGDFVLKEMCLCIKQAVSSDSIIGRIGGEEFSVFLKESNHAVDIADMLREEVQNHTFDYAGQPIKVTISIGVACGKGHTFNSLYQKADRMLYLAKESGKNCVRTDISV